MYMGGINNDNVIKVQTLFPRKDNVNMASRCLKHRQGNYM
jgi:hypothetical protein